MQSEASCAETVLFAYTSNLAFAVTRVGSTTKDLPLPPVPLAPSHKTDNVAYFEQVQTYFCESYCMELVNLMPIGIIKFCEEAGTKLMYIVSGEIEKDTVAKLDTPLDVSSFHFLEIDHITQKLTVGASTLLYGAACLFKAFTFKKNLQLKKKKKKKKEGEIKNISRVEDAEQRLDYTTPVNKNMADMPNLGPTIEFSTVLSLNPYVKGGMQGMASHASAEGVDHDITQNIVDADVHLQENNDGFASKGIEGAGKEDENGTQSSTSLMMMDKVQKKEDKTAQKSRRPTLDELGFGEKVPRQLKVENWLSK